MSGTGRCDDVRPALGVYVLGAIEPPDRRLIEAHLACCARCRSELAGLAGLPALLGKVSADEVAAVVEADAMASLGRSWPPDQVLRSQLAMAVRIRRNRLRAWIIAAAIAGLVAGSAAVAVWHVRPTSARQPLAHQTSSLPPAAGRSEYVTTARVTDPRTRVSATVRYSSQLWGLLLGVRIGGVAIGTPCRLEVLDALGRGTTAGSWTITAGPGTWYPGSSSLSLDDVSGFIVASGGKVLVLISLRNRSPRRVGGRRRRAGLLPHDRRSAPAFGVIRPPPRSGHQSSGSVQVVSGNRSAIPTRSSGHATDPVLAGVLRPPSLFRG